MREDFEYIYSQSYGDEAVWKLARDREENLTTHYTTITEGERVIKPYVLYV